MLFSDIEELIKKASAPVQGDDVETEKVASESAPKADTIDDLVKEIDQELSTSLEKRASKVGIAKLLVAIDILQ